MFANLATYRPNEGVEVSTNEDEHLHKTSMHATADTAYGSRLLTELRVANFKALSGEHTIPLAPLTLVYGPNAAGKSSVIQALLLLAQSVHADEFTPRGQLTDVRDFAQVINGHDTEKALTLGVRFIIEEEDSAAVMLASFADSDVAVAPITVEAGIELTYTARESSPRVDPRSSFEVGRATLSEPLSAPVREGDDDETGPWGPYFQRWVLNLADAGVVEDLVEAIGRLEPAHKDAQRSLALLRFAARAVDSGFASGASLECWVDPVDWKSGLHAPTQLRLSLLPASTPPVAEPPHLEAERVTAEDEAAAARFSASSEPSDSDAIVFHSLDAVASLFTRVEEEARGLFGSDLLPPDSSPSAQHHRERRHWDHRAETTLVSLGPIRPAPKRVHLAEDASDATLPLARRLHRSEDLLHGVNSWLERLDVPYALGVDQLVARRSGAEQGYTLDLTDTRTGVEVSLADVGYGVSQVLPIVAECVTARSTIICIEQPELHLHPRLAADVGELFVDTAKRGNQIIAETHSENILLRVQRLIRAGELSADKVAVLYVSNDSARGAVVSRLRLDEEGDLLDLWPSGFFDDRLADVLGLDRK